MKPLSRLLCAGFVLAGTESALAQPQPTSPQPASPQPASPAPASRPLLPAPATSTETKPTSGLPHLVATREAFRSDEHGRALYVNPIDAALSLPLESVGLILLVSYTGFKDWKWGSASFRFESEGWFGMNAGSGGIDKVGHAYGAYMSSELLYWRLRTVHDNRWVVSFYPAIFGTLLYQYIEIFDGFSVDHGYAYEDAIMNTAGVLASFVRNTFPRARALFDFRLEYFPTKGIVPRPMIDYEGQKFFIAFKPAGIPGVNRTPFRFLELLGGYYTRGFKNPNATEKTAHVVFGVGVSLEQMFLVPLAQRLGEPFEFLRFGPHYLQAPLYATEEIVRRAPR